MSEVGRVLAQGNDRGKIAGELLALAEAMGYPVRVIESRQWGYEAPADVVQALADLHQADHKKVVENIITAAGGVLGESLPAIPEPEAVEEEAPKPKPRPRRAAAEE